MLIFGIGIGIGIKIDQSMDIDINPTELDSENDYRKLMTDNHS